MHSDVHVSITPQGTVKAHTRSTQHIEMSTSTTALRTRGNIECVATTPRLQLIYEARMRQCGDAVDLRETARMFATM